MNVNITLCIQCLNFFITYLFLRYVFFKPVIKIIHHEENKNTQTVHEIAQQESYIATQFNLRQLHWQEFKTHCQFNRPTLNNTTEFPEQVPLPPKTNIDTLFIETKSTECAKIIVDYLKQKDLTS